MPLFGSSHPAQQDMTKKSSRQLCWDARDSFFACLDANNIVDSDKDRKTTKAHCADVEKAYEANCIESWIDYFKQKRVQGIERDAKIKELEKRGAIRMEVESGFKA